MSLHGHTKAQLSIKSCAMKKWYESGQQLDLLNPSARFRPTQKPLKRRYFPDQPLPPSRHHRYPHVEYLELGICR
jgi:hypothetical protein